MQLNLASWNINGIRAAMKKGFWQITKTLNLDVLCLQETKANTQIMHNLSTILDYRPYRLDFACANTRQGYSGVATFSLDPNFHKYNLVNPLFDLSDIQSESYKTKPKHKQLSYLGAKIGLGLDKFDQEGRVVTTFYEVTKKLQIGIVNAYYPQGGRGQFRIDYKIEFYQAILNYIQNLRQQNYQLILCGDFNTTVADIDLARPEQNRNTTGCLPEERAALNEFFQAGFIDTFRYFYPNVAGKYTYWDQITRARERNVGWRIDYFLVQTDLLPYLKQAAIHDDIFGSDHCPVSITLEFSDDPVD